MQKKKICVIRSNPVPVQLTFAHPAALKGLKGATFYKVTIVGCIPHMLLPFLCTALSEHNCFILLKMRIGTTYVRTLL